MYILCILHHCCMYEHILYLHGTFICYLYASGSWHLLVYLMAKGYVISVKQKSKYDNKGMLVSPYTQTVPYL